MEKQKETTFENVVLGARVFLNGYMGQKIDEPISDSNNKHKQSSNVMWPGGCNNPKFLKKDTRVKTTYYSLKDEPEMRHQ